MAVDAPSVAAVTASAPATGAVVATLTVTTTASANDEPASHVVEMIANFLIRIASFVDGFV